MSVENKVNRKEQETFDITRWFSRVYTGGYTYFYSNWKSDNYFDKPFAFSSCEMNIPKFFKVYPSNEEERGNPSVMSVLDLRNKDIAEKLLLSCIDLADRVDKEKNKITAMTPLTLNKDVVDIWGIEFSIEYMPEHIITSSGDSMRDLYTDQILDRYLGYLNNSYLDT